MPSIQTPQWVRDAVFYQIFPDRFAQSVQVPKPTNLEPWNTPPTVHGFKGGDLLGVLEHLDYLQDLGITAIYFNPIFQSVANHRYHTHDYWRVDPILGGDRAFRRFLDEAHSRGVRVVLDGVFNHASRGFFQFNHVVENGPASPYTDWFMVKRFPLRPFGAPKGQHGYESWWDLPELPKLNVATPAVREFLWDVATHWIKLGIDGWRLDVPSEIDDDAFWQEFRARVKSVNPEAYILGEIWHDSQRWLQGDQFDAVMNYPVTRACLGFFVGENLLQSEVERTGYHHIDTLDAKGFMDEVDRVANLYDRQISEVQFNLLGSHDTPRFKTLARGDSSAYRLATLFLMTYPGAPCIYYGDEIGLEGNRDPGCRGTFPWDEGVWDQPLHDHVRRCISLRRDHAVLRRGDFRPLFSGHGVVAYGRQLANDTAIVVLNTGRHPVTLDIPVEGYAPESEVYHDVWHTTQYHVSGGSLDFVRIPARDGVVLTNQRT